MPNRYSYADQENDYTVTADNKLYCERKGARHAIQSFFGLGAIGGVLLANMISDYHGRKFSLLLSQFCLILSLVLLLLGSWLDCLPLFYIAQILSGYGAVSMFSIIYVYIEKMMSKRWADRGVIWINAFA
jgi:MFS family permease